MPEIMGHNVERIQDDGQKFILKGGISLKEDLETAFDPIGLGISVSMSNQGKVHISYAENNRQIVMQILKDHMTGNYPHTSIFLILFFHYKYCPNTVLVLTFDLRLLCSSEQYYVCK